MIYGIKVKDFDLIFQLHIEIRILSILLLISFEIAFHNFQTYFL